MKKLRVTQVFRDLYNYDKIYNVGDVIECDDERANKLITLGLAEVIKPNRKRA